MITEPDGGEVVATLEGADGAALAPLLILDRITAYLDSLGIGTGPIAWSRIGDGQSNITYLIERGSERLVLRRGPRPPLPRSTHDMVREAGIQRLLHANGVAVPRIIAVCEDPDLLGVPFYLMEYLDGVIVTDAAPPQLDSAEQRRAISVVCVDTLVGLHDIDVTAEGFSTFGRPDGYLSRQVTRFTALWNTSAIRDLPDVNYLSTWLQENMPDSQRASVVHGDYRIGNLMLEHDAPARVLAILDWEMATIGDPLADLGYLTATYSEPGDTPTVMGLTGATAQPGYLTRAELVERYAASSPLDLTALPWYQTLALWKASIFCEAIYRRWLDGERPGDTFAPALELGVPDLLRRARSFANV